MTTMIVNFLPYNGKMEEFREINASYRLPVVPRKGERVVYVDNGGQISKGIVETVEYRLNPLFGGDQVAFVYLEKPINAQS